LIKFLPYILFEKYIYILALKMASSGNQHCTNCIGALSFPIGCLWTPLAPLCRRRRPGREASLSARRCSRFHGTVNTSFPAYSCTHDIHQRTAEPAGTQTDLFTARRYASAVYAMALCPSVCLSVFVTSRSSIEMAERIELVFAWRLFSDLSYTVL